MKKNTKSICFVIIVLLIIITKQCLVNNIPIMAYAHAKQDDALMVDMAKNILDGKWLGEYNELTLTKGVMFPLFLCVSNILGINYISFQTLFYSIACLLFIYGIKDFIKSKKWLLIIFIALVFNPVSFATNTLSRVYRNGITMSQVLIIFGSYIGLYMNRKNKAKSTIYSLLAGFEFTFLYHTREDAIWIIPFICTVTLILVILLIKEEKKQVLKSHKLLLFIYFLPFIIIYIVTMIISMINYSYYGIFTYNELNKSSFTKCMKTMYSIKPKEEYYRVSFTDEKIERMCLESKTLNSIKAELYEAKYLYADYGNGENGNQTEDGWFFWVLREAASKKGYYETAQKAEDFYAKVTEELETAIEQEKLETQPVMPSSLMPPWRKGKAVQLLNAFTEEIKFISTYKNVEPKIEKSVIANKYNILEDFENITNNTAILDKTEVRILGWYANLEEENLKYTIQNQDGKILFEFAKLEYREDIKQFLKSSYNLERDGNSNFEIIIQKEKKDDIFFVAEKDGKIYTKEQITQKEYILNEKYILSIDNITFYQEDLEEKAEKQAVKLNSITNIYKFFGLAIFLLSILIFIIFIIIMIIGIKKREYKNVNTVLILSGIILSLIVLLLGVAYNEISSCDSINYMYLSGTYPLVLIFEGIAFAKFFEDILNLKQKSGKINEFKNRRK